jgi:hypothetical protein
MVTAGIKSGANSWLQEKKNLFVAPLEQPLQLLLDLSNHYLTFNIVRTDPTVSNTNPGPLKIRLVPNPSKPRVYPFQEAITL